MNKNKILTEIKIIKSEIEILNNKIKLLEKNLRKSNLLDNDKINKYEEYMLSKGLSNKSISNYRVSLKSLKILLEKYCNFKLNCEIYEINNLNMLLEIINKFKNTREIQEVNLKRHHSLSAALNNYCNYLKMQNQTDEFIFETDELPDSKKSKY